MRHLYINYFRFFCTTKYLKPSQILYRLKNQIPFYRIQKLKNLKPPLDITILPYPLLNKKEKQRKPPNTYVLLNQENTIHNWIPNVSCHWLYELHYFNFIFEIKETTEYEKIILDWIQNVKIGTKHIWHPFTTSLRLCNWIWSFSHHHTQTTTSFKKYFFTALYQHLIYIENNLEFDVLGNHLLENLKALIVGGVFFQKEKTWKKGCRLLKSQLSEQILSDGGHYERSPMYHVVVIEVMLACYKTLLKVTEESELRWLKKHIINASQLLKDISYNNQFPHFNDSANGYTHTPHDILNHIESTFNIKLANKNNAILHQYFGLYTYKTPNLYLCMDIGKIGPDFLCAHAHNDLLSYSLTINNIPIVTDSGTYDYEAGRPIKWRHYFRSTKAHNTIMVDDQEQNDIWGNFRVGKRGYPFAIDASSQHIEASHDCYKNLDILIKRRIDIINNETGIKVTDTILNTKKTKSFTNNIHFAKGSKIIQKESQNNETHYIIENKNQRFRLSIAHDNFTIKESESWESLQFNKKHQRLNIQINGVCKKKETHCTYQISAISSV